MALKLSLLVLVVSLSTLSALRVFYFEPVELNVSEISSALSRKGYKHMSRVLQEALPTLIPFDLLRGGYNFTIFCPRDDVFRHRNPGPPPDPPTELLRYHIVPRRLRREDLGCSLPHGSQLETLRTGFRLVSTTTPFPILGRLGFSDSINGVHISQYEIYSDERVTIHGVDNFFTGGGISTGVSTDYSRDPLMGWVQDLVDPSLVDPSLLLFMNAFFMCLSLACVLCCCRSRRYHKYTRLD